MQIKFKQNANWIGKHGQLRRGQLKTTSWNSQMFLTVLQAHELIEPFQLDAI